MICLENKLCYFIKALSFEILLCLEHILASILLSEKYFVCFSRVVFALAKINFCFD